MKIRAYYDLDKFYEYDEFKAICNKEDSYLVFFTSGIVMSLPKEIFNKVIIL